MAAAAVCRRRPRRRTRTPALVARALSHRHADPGALVLQDAEQHALAWPGPAGSSSRVVPSRLGARLRRRARRARSSSARSLEPALACQARTRPPSSAGPDCRRAVRARWRRGALSHAAVALGRSRARSPSRSAAVGLGRDGRLDPPAAPAAQHLLGGERGHRAPAAPPVRLVDAQVAGSAPPGSRSAGSVARWITPDGTAVHAHLVAA